MFIIDLSMTVCCHHINDDSKQSLEQLCDSLQEHSGVEAAPTMDTGIVHWAGTLRGKFSGTALRVDPCHVSLFSPCE